MNKLKRCARCLLPETFETIEFNEDGVCNICNSTIHKQKKAYFWWTKWSQTMKFHGHEK